MWSLCGLFIRNNWKSFNIGADIGRWSAFLISFSLFRLKVCIHTNLKHSFLLAPVYLSMMYWFDFTLLNIYSYSHFAVNIGCFVWLVHSWISVQWLYLYISAFISLYFYTKQLFVMWTLTECTLSTVLRSTTQMTDFQYLSQVQSLFCNEYVHVFSLISPVFMT